MVDGLHWPANQPPAGKQNTARASSEARAVLVFQVQHAPRFKAVKRFFQKKDIVIIAPSLGGIETLITRPAATSHAGMPPQERIKTGISDTLIRISTGIEAADDIIEDLEKGL